MNASYGSNQHFKWEKINSNVNLLEGKFFSHFLGCLNDFMSFVWSSMDSMDGVSKDI